MDKNEGAAEQRASRAALAFGSLIRGRRKGLKMRQDQLALATGVGRRFLIDLEAGKPSCQLGRSLLVADALGLRLVDMFIASGPSATIIQICLIYPTKRWTNEPPTSFLEQRLVGTIDVDKEGPAFIYDPSWIELRGAFPISTTMPLRSQRVAPDTFLPWAANLLPENEQFHTLGQILGMARGDVVGLLSAIGGDTAGALSIGQAGRTASVQWRPVGKQEDLERVIEELPSKPFLVGDEGICLCLSRARRQS